MHTARRGATHKSNEAILAKQSIVAQNTTMKSIQYTEHGSEYDVMLQLVDDGVAADATSAPPPEGFATVKIVAASGNPIDFKVAQGGLKGAWDCPLPMAMGYDFSGTIVAVSADGADSSASFKVGDDVFAVNWGQVSYKWVHSNSYARRILRYRNTFRSSK